MSGKRRRTGWSDRRPKVDPWPDLSLRHGRPETTVEEARDLDRPWVTIVWNDPVNLMNYVTFVLQELFGYDEPTATTLMLQVHHEGKAIVSSGPRERMEHDTSRLHAYGLWASYQRDS